MLYFKVTLLCRRLNNNIHSATITNDHFDKSLPISNKGVKDGGMLPLISQDRLKDI